MRTHILSTRTIRLGAAAACLCALAGLPAASAGEDASAVPGAPPLSARLDFDALKETRLYPLFAPSRRPPPPPPVEAAPVEEMPVAPVAASLPPPPAPPALDLVGIVEANGGAVALLKDPASGKTSRVSTGEAVGDWRLTIVGPRMIALAHPDAAEQRILRVTFP